MNYPRGKRNGVVRIYQGSLIRDGQTSDAIQANIIQVTLHSAEGTNKFYCLRQDERTFLWFKPEKESTNWIVNDKGKMFVSPLTIPTHSTFAGPLNQTLNQIVILYDKLSSFTLPMYILISDMHTVEIHQFHAVKKVQGLHVQVRSQNKDQLLDYNIPEYFYYTDDKVSQIVWVPDVHGTRTGIKLVDNGQTHLLVERGSIPHLSKLDFLITPFLALVMMDDLPPYLPKFNT